jgi:MFS family permease
MTAIHATIRVPKVRWGIGALLGAGVLINYFDRINLSVGAPQLQQEFGLTDGELGWLFSGFFWSYALLQIPTGMILDRLGVASVYCISAFLWSLASGATAFAGGFGGVLAARLLLGVAEGPAFPASAKATGYWFPRGERAMATSIFDAAAKFANVVGVTIGRAGGGTVWLALGFHHYRITELSLFPRLPDRLPRPEQASTAEPGRVPVHPRRRRHTRRPGTER